MNTFAPKPDHCSPITNSSAVPDTIHISQLELRAHIGVPDEERATPQRLTVDLTLEPARGFSDLADDLARTVDYFEVCRAVQALAAERPRKLIETLAEEIAALVLARFAVVSVEVELRKYILPDTQFVAVHLHREK
ncbi:MAG: dihydroneopterin aldolase [Chthoniobacteraceae bacterium]